MVIQSGFINSIKRYFLLNEIYKKNDTSINIYWYWYNCINYRVVKRSLDKFRRICFTIRNNFIYKRFYGYNKNKYRDSRQRERRFFIEHVRKTEVSKKKFERYNILNLEVFTPLKDDIITENEVSYSNLHNFTFDISNIRNKPYYSEGMKHLNQDISPTFQDDFEKLREEVNRYNEELENFETTGIYDLISCHFERYGFTVTRDSSIPPTNTIAIIYESLYILKREWCRGIPFDYSYKNNSIIVENIIMATVSDDNEIEIKKRIDELKYSNEILEKYHKLNDTFNEIKKIGKELSHKIEFEVISKINKMEYNTTCDECTNFINDS